MGAPKAWTYTPWRSGPCDLLLGLPWWLSGKESACQSTSSILGLGRSPGEGEGCLFQYSGLENSMDCIVHGVSKSRIRLSNFHFHSDKESACQSRRCRRPRFNPWVGKILWRKNWQPTPVFLPGKSHGQWNLVCYGPWGHKESGNT